MGGHDKNLPWEKLKILSNLSQLHPIFFGEFGAQAKKITQLKGPVFETLAKALKELPKLIQKDDIVLLSPGGTSHDEFKNFEERGIFFKNEILKY
jgi:UDP-N-acetylmuramoylalanine--D-glutamate ligase